MSSQAIFQALRPVEWDDIFQQSTNLSHLLPKVLNHGRAIIASVPGADALPELAATSQKTYTHTRNRSVTDPPPVTLPLDSTASHTAHDTNATTDDLPSGLKQIPEQQPLSSHVRLLVERLRRDWKEVKGAGGKENTLGVTVFKMSASDGKGSWFARRSVHRELGFERWKSALIGEFGEALRVGAVVRGLGAQERLEDKEAGHGRVQVYRLGAQFPGPTAPRDFVTMILAAESRTPSACTLVSRPLREFIVVSRPCEHQKSPPISGTIRGSYESVEMIREIPEADNVSVEWTMVTRSDPGGNVPRFMIERGTPGGICSDAAKFYKWMKETHLSAYENLYCVHDEEPNEEPESEPQLENHVEAETESDADVITDSDSSDSSEASEGHMLTKKLSNVSAVGTGGTAISYFPTIHSVPNIAENEHEDAASLEHAPELVPLPLSANGIHGPPDLLNGPPPKNPRRSMMGIDDRIESSNTNANVVTNSDSTDDFESDVESDTASFLSALSEPDKLTPKPPSPRGSPWPSNQGYSINQDVYTRNQAPRLIVRPSTADASTIRTWNDPNGLGPGHLDRAGHNTFPQTHWRRHMARASDGQFSLYRQADPSITGHSHGQKCSIDFLHPASYGRPRRSTAPSAGSLRTSRGHAIYAHSGTSSFSSRNKEHRSLADILLHRKASKNLRKEQERQRKEEARARKEREKQQEREMKAEIKARREEEKERLRAAKAAEKERHRADKERQKAEKEAEKERERAEREGRASPSRSRGESSSWENYDTTSVGPVGLTHRDSHGSGAVPRTAVGLEDANMGLVVSFGPEAFRQLQNEIALLKDQNAVLVGKLGQMGVTEEEISRLAAQVAPVHRRTESSAAGV